METSEAISDDHGVPDVIVNTPASCIGPDPFRTTALTGSKIVGVNLMVSSTAVKCSHGDADRYGAPQLNVASAASFTPSRTLAAYSATKACGVMLSESLRCRASWEGNRFSSIYPHHHTPITRATRYVGTSVGAEQYAARRK